MSEPSQTITKVSPCLPLPPRDKMTTQDIGYQGMVHVDLGSPYMKLTRPFVEKKELIGLDFWAYFDKSAAEGVNNPFIEGIKAVVPKHLQGKKYPHIWTFERHVGRVMSGVSVE